MRPSFDATSWDCKNKVSATQKRWLAQRRKDRQVRRKGKASRKAIYAQRKPCLDSGSERIRLPDAAKIALHAAGKIGGSGGSPSPVGEFSVGKKCTSISVGASDIRTGT